MRDRGDQEARRMERKLIKTHRDLDVYQVSFDIAMQIFQK